MDARATNGSLETKVDTESNFDYLNTERYLQPKKKIILRASPSPQ